MRIHAQAVRAVMTHADEPLTVEQVAQHFEYARRSDVQALLETLAALGHVEGAPGTLSGTKRFPASCLEALS